MSNATDSVVNFQESRLLQRRTRATIAKRKTTLTPKRIRISAVVARTQTNRFRSNVFVASETHSGTVLSELSFYILSTYSRRTGGRYRENISTYRTNKIGGWPSTLARIPRDRDDDDANGGDVEL